MLLDDPVLVSELKAICGDANVIVDPGRMADYSHDEFADRSIWHVPDAVVKPGSTETVADIVRFCGKNRIPLVTRGGATGLCGGCVPSSGGIVMSFERMDKVLEIDRKNMMAVCQPGLTLAGFYKELEDSGLFFPPHPGDESATIGGIIATNAGGSRAIKYGAVRNFTRGLQVVLADGTVTEIGGKFVKNSSGYSLLHLLIGSEGTLAVITKAVISLMAPPAGMVTLVVPFNDLHDAIATVPDVLLAGIIPLAVEFLEEAEIRLTETFVNQKWPALTGKAHLMFICDGTSEEEALSTAEKIGAICKSHKALDVLVADSRERQAAILNLRSRMYDALKPEMVENLDIVVPRASIADFCDDVRRMEEELGLWIPSYGHAADGNVHNHLMRSRWKDGRWLPIPDWQQKTAVARNRLHELGRKYSGAVSGEHGIGLVKKDYLKDFAGSVQMTLMKAVKKAFDPGNILNPGKIFD